ncbi:lactosylceramide 4-alpha-galactosyltransferase [Microplitis demolitor]|uniref:lactosylceramide 4-alpha-galactosyltransferase n=1 Tax=Microplitis demolitor TaxID=69319 RepID=UPI00235B5BD1|nr:lactosylceramide 4-alpha-galactosyltransferase [Microplitis demolitor]
MIIGIYIDIFINSIKKVIKMRKKIIISSGCGILLFIFVLSCNNELIARFNPPIEDISCYSEPSNFNSIETFDMKVDGDRLLRGKNIFFHETSCFDDGIVLNARQSCAVESAAKMNPGTNIYLLVLSNMNFSNATKNIIKHLMSYKNIHIRRIFMEKYVKNTPIEEWWASNVLKSSRWPRSHMSDILRYLTLWKFPGIYLDLDVVVKSSLEKLTDFTGAESWDDVAAGVIGFGPSHLGRQIADACLRDLKKNFRGDIWGNNGPGVITRTLQKICATKYARDMTSKRCHGFTVYPPSAFYPIHYKMWKQYFESKNKTQVLKVIENAYAIHVWNKLSHSEIINVGSDVPYATIASQYCPQVYNNCGKVF